MSEMTGETFKKFQSRFQEERHQIVTNLHNCSLSTSNLKESIFEIVHLLQNSMQYGFAAIDENQNATSHLSDNLSHSAEREGFEPSIQFNPYDGLANRSFRPLRHLSIISLKGLQK